MPIEVLKALPHPPTLAFITTRAFEAQNLQCTCEKEWPKKLGERERGEHFYT